MLRNARVQVRTTTGSQSNDVDMLCVVKINPSLLNFTIVGMNK